MNSQYRNPKNIVKKIVKIAEVFAHKPNAFTFVYKPTKLKISGTDMTNVDFQDNGGLDVTFDYAGSNYTFAKADVKILKRLRSRKYSIEVNSVTIV